MREDIDVSIWQSRITLGDFTGAGTVKEVGARDPSRIQ
jgi:hypothetical protein